MNKLFIIGTIFILSVSIASGYICIDIDNDTQEVIEFKSKINILSIKEDIIKHNLTEEGFNLKLKYFSPCKEW